MTPPPTTAESAGWERSDGGEVPAPTLLTGMATAVAAGAFVGWALLPLPTTVAGRPLFAVAAVATTLWAGLSFLRRRLPSGVLAEGFYLMGLAVLARPGAVLVSGPDPTTGLAGPGGAFVTALVALVVAGVLLTAGWRLDTRARKARFRRARRRVRAGMARSRQSARSGPPAGRADFAGGRPSARQRHRDE